jgi:CHAD domain-containing protein
MTTRQKTKPTNIDTLLPPSAPITFAACAEKAIAKHYQKIAKYAPDVVADKAPEALHQMRVGMRRLRSTLQVFASILDLPKAGSERNIAKIGRDLGKVRDIDVLQADLQNIYAPTLPESEQVLLAKVLKYLAKKRKVALKKMRSLLSSKLYQNFSAVYGQWPPQPIDQPAAPDAVSLANLGVEFVIPDLLIPAVARLFLHPGWLVGTSLVDGKLALAAIAPDQVESQLKIHDLALHDLRKQIKRVRYQTEFFTDFYGPDYAAEIQHFRNAQEALGKLQDSFVLESLLAKALSRDLATQLPVFSEQLRQQRMLAWQELQPIQALYIDRDFRDHLIEILLQPISALPTKPVKKTTGTKTPKSTTAKATNTTKTTKNSNKPAGIAKAKVAARAKSNRSTKTTTTAAKTTKTATKVTKVAKLVEAEAPTDNQLTEPKNSANRGGKQPKSGESN